MATSGGVTVTVRDRGLRALLRQMDHVPDLRVGIYGTAAAESHEDSPLTVGEVMARHELGAGVPRRSWLRDWISESASEIQSAWSTTIRNAVHRREAMALHVGRMGALFVGQIQERIASRIPPPNAPATIARKGSDVPLIDSGQGRTAIAHEVME